MLATQSVFFICHDCKLWSQVERFLEVFENSTDGLICGRLPLSGERDFWWRQPFQIYFKSTYINIAFTFSLPLPFKITRQIANKSVSTCQNGIIVKQRQMIYLSFSALLSKEVLSNGIIMTKANIFSRSLAIDNST